MATGGGSAILKRLAALNRSGVLLKPLQYSQVKGDLTSISEEWALRILNQLEVEAANVPEPVEYVKAAAERAALGDEPQAEAETPGNRKRKAGSLEGPGPGHGEGIVVKRIRLLNSSGKLAQPIVLSKVKGALSSLGIGQAMTILKGLEDVAQGVRDPTGYIRTAVRGAGGVVPSDELDADEEEAAEDGTAPFRVKQEVDASNGGHVLKQEPRGRDFRGAKKEDLTEAERIERHIGWLNRNKDLQKPITVGEVLPALDCIGFKQSMRVLKRFEENSAEVEDPDEYIKDLVARSGWIWSKPDIIDEDEKVAKRVAWLNQFGGLQQPIDYAQVADALDGLKVAHAMVLLREMEVQAHTVADPTDYIKKAVGLTGADEVQIPLADSGSSIALRVTSMNQSGGLAAPIDYAEVGDDLARIGDDEALQLLQDVAKKGSTVKDPTGYIKFKLKAKLAALGPTLGEAAADDTKILKRIEWLNDYGGLMRDIDYNRVAATLETVGVDHAMTILNELEDSRMSVRDPNAFILNAVKASWKRKAADQAGNASKRPAPAAARGVAAAGGGTSDLKAVAGFMTFLDNHPKVKKPIKFTEIAAALDALGSKRALQVLHQMQDKGLGLADPLSYIKAAAQRSGLTTVKAEAEEEEGDDVAKITKRLKWLNQFAGLQKKIRINDVVGALYCLGLPQTMSILRGLQEQASKVPDPTWFIKAAVQRANGVRVTEPPPGDGEEAEPEQEEAAEAGGADEEEEEDGVVVEFEDPEGDEDVEEQEPLVEFDLGPEAEEEEPLVEVDLGPEEEEEEPPRPKHVAKAAAPKEPAKAAAGPRRVVGGISGATGKLVPTRPNYQQQGAQHPLMVKSEMAEEIAPAEVEAEEEAPRESKATMLPITPQEKMVKVRDYAIKHKLELDQTCLKSLARLPFYRARDMIDDVVLGGRNRQGVHNPSKYLTIGCQKLPTGLGVEQGIAMELAVSLGVVLNNDALDELACIPRKESHAIIRELSRNSEAREDPMEFIKSEVLKCRAQMDARPWPPAG